MTTQDGNNSTTRDTGSLERSWEQRTHPIPRKYLELVQDFFVFVLCMMIFAVMAMKLFELGKLLLRGTDFSLIIGDILFILVLVELFRLLLMYLEEHRISVATMVEVGIVATLREVMLTGALHIQWQELLVISAFILTLGLVLRESGIRLHPRRKKAAPPRIRVSKNL